MPTLPTGTVTFLFTDIEGSTRLLQSLGDGRAAKVFAEHRQLLRETFAGHGGVELETQGDGLLVAFPRARDAVHAAVHGQRAMSVHSWPDGITLRVRMGVHTGEPTSGGGALYGLGLHRAARICGAGWGGQVLLSHTTADLIANDPPDGVRLRDLGDHRLKDLERPERIFQVLHPQLKGDFPPLRSLDAVPAANIAARPRQRRRSIDSLAVLPLANESGDQEAEYLSDGLTESLISRLSQLPGIRVMARSTVFRYKGQDADPQAVGQALNVGAVLTGRVQQRGDALVIGMELVDVANGWQLWGEQYHRPLSDIVTVQAEISTEVSARLRLKLTPRERTRLTAATTRSPEAYQAYIKGRYLWNKFTEASHERSVEFFKRAIDIDPGYALAYAGLADAYHELSGVHSPPREIMPRAKAAAAKALELDPALAEAHAALGWIIWRFDWDWATAEREFKCAIELNANYAIVYGMYGLFLDSMGRFDESLAAHQRAQSLDPLSLIIDVGLGYRLYMARQYDRAIEHYRKTLETDPNFAQAHRRLSSAYVQKGMFEEAIAAFQRTGGGAGVAAEGLFGYVYALSGKTGEARSVLAKLRDLATQRYVSPYVFALVYLGLGENDHAIKWLERTYEERDGVLVYLKVAPQFDPLRDDPRFQDLMRRVGFEP